MLHTKTLSQNIHKNNVEKTKQKKRQHLGEDSGNELRNCTVCAGWIMGTPKPLILPWLVSQLDLGQLKGVAWLDESRTKFRIPWKHGLRQDAQMADFGIFQAWAEASGAYTPGKDKPDLSTWKRNFRSALNRKEVLRLAEDRSKDPFDPHKVYEFVTPGAARDFVHLDTSPDTNGKSSLFDHQVRRH